MYIYIYVYIYYVFYPRCPLFWRPSNLPTPSTGCSADGSVEAGDVRPSLQTRWAPVPWRFRSKNDQTKGFCATISHNPAIPTMTIYPMIFHGLVEGKA